MDDTLSAKTIRLAQLLKILAAKDIIVYDVKNYIWADYMIVATTNSYAHARGILVQLERKCQQLELHWQSKPKVTREQVWLLCDLGSIIIHLMDDSARNFYEFNHLYFDSPTLQWSSQESANEPC